MMHLIEFSKEMLLCHEGDSIALPSAFTDGRQCGAFGPLAAWDVVGADTALELLRSERLDYELDRYLDHLWLWSLAANDARRQVLLDLVFDAIAPDYEQLIHAEQNLENIRYLLEVLREDCGSLSGRVIVDFGCGTGLSAKAVTVDMRLIAVDRCGAMRQAAAAYGLEVWGPAELARTSSCSLDGAFASYVLHLLPELGLLELLWSRLRPRAAFAANFHKGRGLESVSRCLKALGAQEVVIPPPQSCFAHGDYRKYVRTG